MTTEHDEKTVNTDEKSEKENTSNNENSNMIPKSRFDQVNEKKKAAESELSSFAEELKNDVPEEMRELIPELPAGQLIKWIRTANAKGLFAEKSAVTLDSKRANEKKTINYDDMSTHDKIASGYKT